MSRREPRHLLHRVGDGGPLAESCDPAVRRRATRQNPRAHPDLLLGVERAGHDPDHGECDACERECSARELWIRRQPVAPKGLAYHHCRLRAGYQIRGQERTSFRGADTEGAEPVTDDGLRLDTLRTLLKAEDEGPSHASTRDPLQKAHVRAGPLHHPFGREIVYGLVTARPRCRPDLNEPVHVGIGNWRKEGGLCDREDGDGQSDAYAHGSDGCEGERGRAEKAPGRLSYDGRHVSVSAKCTRISIPLNCPPLPTALGLCRAC